MTFRHACVTSHAALPWALLLVVAACGDVPVGDDEGDGPDAAEATDIHGFYEITAHAFETSCAGAPTPVTDGPPVFEVYEESPFGLRRTFVRSCDSVDDCDDDSDSQFAGSNIQATGDQTYGGSLYVSFAADPCELFEHRAEATITSTSPLQLRVDVRIRKTTAKLTGDACSPKATKARVDDMECI